MRKEGDPRRAARSVARLLHAELGGVCRVLSEGRAPCERRQKNERRKVFQGHVGLLPRRFWCGVLCEGDSYRASLKLHPENRSDGDFANPATSADAVLASTQNDSSQRCFRRSSSSPGSSARRHRARHSDCSTVRLQRPGSQKLRPQQRAGDCGQTGRSS